MAYVIGIGGQKETQTDGQGGEADRKKKVWTNFLSLLLLAKHARVLHRDVYTIYYHVLVSMTSMCIVTIYILIVWLLKVVWFNWANLYIL